MITLKKVSKQYPCGKSALHEVSFSLQRGEMAFLTGHSGAGKSTLLKLIMCMEPLSQGDMVVNGAKISQLSTTEIMLMRRNIGMVFQNPHLLYDRSVFDNVALPLLIHGYHASDIKKRVAAALTKVGLEHTQQLKPSILSVGERQRIGIARAVVNRPPILLADEPTGNLDPQLSQEILRIFTEFNAIGTTVMVATHDLTLLPGTPHRIVALQNGKLVGGVA